VVAAVDPDDTAADQLTNEANTVACHRRNDASEVSRLAAAESRTQNT
jgi:hypothetical protein